MGYCMNCVLYSHSYDYWRGTCTLQKKKVYNCKGVYLYVAYELLDLFHIGINCMSSEQLFPDRLSLMTAVYSYKIFNHKSPTVQELAIVDGDLMVNFITIHFSN